MRIAPHLVQPLPILIPTYGHSLRGKEIFSIALLLNRVIGFGQNDLGDRQKHLPRGGIISKEDCRNRIPGVYEKGLTGGVIVYDCQMLSSERLVLSFARSAHQSGAELANYVEATELLTEGRRVCGIKARDVLTGDELCIHARTVVNASGPWMERVLASFKDDRLAPRLSLSKAFNVLINRQLFCDYAVGLYARSSCKDQDAILDKGSRLFFINPWHNRSLIGTAHLPYYGDPDSFEVAEAEIQSFLNEINEAYPRADIKFKDISCVYGGLLPALENNGNGVQLARHHQIYDHHKEDRVEGLISVSGVKFTEARYVAEKTVDTIFRKLEKRPPKSLTGVTPVYGGQIESFDEFVKRETHKMSGQLTPEAAALLLSHYGSGYSDVIKYMDKPSEQGRTPVDRSRLMGPEVLHAIREEMAQKLADIVFRRTTIALPGNLTNKSLQTCGRIVAQELGWKEERLLREVAEVRAACPRSPLATEKAA